MLFLEAVLGLGEALFYGALLSFDALLFLSLELESLP